MKNKNHLKIIEEKYQSIFDDFRKINEDDMNEYINNKLGELPIHRFLNS